MKRLFYVACLSLILTGCGTARKMASSKQEAAKYTEATTETEKSSGSFLIDTTKHSGTEVTYTKIEFYPPEPNKEPAGISPQGPPAEAKPNNRPPSTGAVKSIEKLTIKKESEEKGVTESQSSTEATKATEITSEATVDEVTAVEPTPDPYRWRYIFGILVICIVIVVAGYFWLRKAGVFVKVASLVRKIF